MSHDIYRWYSSVSNAFPTERRSSTQLPNTTQQLKVHNFLESIFTCAFWLSFPKYASYGTLDIVYDIHGSKIIHPIVPTSMISDNVCSNFKAI